MSSYFAELAYLGQDEPHRNVTIEVTGDRISAVTSDSQPLTDAYRLPGLTLPGFVNGHSHVFHRAIRGCSQSGVGSFWAWRDQMYQVAERLGPEDLYELALATFAEMSLAGVTSVGEFFYLHHDAGGARYAEPNVMGDVVCRAAEQAGLRITLLDTLYLQGGVDGRPLVGVQRRFDDGGFHAWAERVQDLPTTPLRRPGAAIHSVRAVPRGAFAPLADFARERQWPIHAHVSEQVAENDQAIEVFGMTPTALLADAGVLGSDFTSVHATHLSAADVAATGGSASTVCMCCTTERDLADGIGPAAQLLQAGASLSIGSDGHAIIDLLEETRAMENDLRLMTGTRGHFSLPELANALTRDGAASLGWQAGVIAPGMLADFTCLALDTPRTAGARSSNPLAHIIFGASAADVHTVIRGGQVVVADHCHQLVPDAGHRLDRIISRLLAQDGKE